MPTGAARDTSEDYIKKRYERWRTMAVPFDYKRAKGGRLAAILRDTGGLPGAALEVGVGPGAIAGLLSQRGIRLIGMDLSLDALFRAQEHCRDKQVSLVRGSGFSLPFRSNSLPVVYASQVLHLFDDDARLALMREAYRVLESGGRFVFDMKNALTHATLYLRSTAARRQRNFPPTSQLYQLLTRTGFIEITTKPGLLPGLRSPEVPDIPVVRSLAHTRFFIARKA